MESYQKFLRKAHMHSHRSAWRCLAFLVVVSALSLQAETPADIAGVWQGDLKAGRGFTVTIKFTQVASAWTGELGSEESPEKLALKEIVLDKRGVSFSVPSLGAHFSGQIATDNAKIAGNWTQGAVSTPLQLERQRASEDVTTAKLGNMPKNAHPKFEVATIKPSREGDNSQGFMLEGRTVHCENERLKDMLSLAYSVHPSMIDNLKGWMASERFDINGYPDIAGEPNMAQMREMYKDILETRFGLKYHLEKRVVPVYVLETGKPPLRITKSLGDPNGSPDQTMNWSSVSATLRETNATMKEFATMLDDFVDRPNVDRTGLEGRYDFVLTWAPNDLSADGNATSKVPNIFGALAELGLKLHAEKEPYDVMVIDSVERPSAN
jgi:uncharacterized protein (TIGR03435 family)